MTRAVRERAEEFCRRFGLTAPILQAPMAGACPVPLAAAVANAGGMGAMGALLTEPAGIAAWSTAFRAESRGPFQINLWIPDPAPRRDTGAEARLREFLGGWGPPVPAGAGDATPPDFAAQCAALLAARPTAASSIMGLFSPAFVSELKSRGIAWLACATTLTEALAAEAAGARPHRIDAARRRNFPGYSTHAGLGGTSGMAGPRGGGRRDRTARLGRCKATAAMRDFDPIDTAMRSMR